VHSLAPFCPTWSFLLTLTAWTLLLPLSAHAQQTDGDEGAPIGAEDAEEFEATERLRSARLHYDRGEFDSAATDFATLLDSPVRLKNRDELHEGFLYYAFTLFLQGQATQDLATEKLKYALQLDPDFSPSPVTTRPDLLKFYTEQRTAYIAENGSISVPPEILFPELQSSTASTRVLRRRRFVPVFGMGLRFLGHPRAGDFLLTTELAAASLNIGSIILRLAVIDDLTPAGYTATLVGRHTNYASFGVFWVAFAVDLIVSLALQRRYNRNPQLRPSSTQSIARRLRPPLLTPTGTGLKVQFW